MKILRGSVTNLTVDISYQRRIHICKKYIPFDEAQSQPHKRLTYFSDLSLEIS